MKKAYALKEIQNVVLAYLWVPVCPKVCKCTIDILSGRFPKFHGRIHDCKMGIDRHAEGIQSHIRVLNLVVFAGIVETGADNLGPVHLDMRDEMESKHAGVIVQLD
jgi:hypothetical protein